MEWGQILSVLTNSAGYLFAAFGLTFAFLGWRRPCRTRNYRALGESRPAVVWCPKYWVPLGELPPRSQIIARLEEYGFSQNQEGEGEEALCFTRGSRFGTFAIRWIKMNVTVTGLQSEEGGLWVEPATSMLDTGDTWRLTQALSGVLGSR